MGTPEFACHSLQSLCEAGLKPCAVVTVPDKPVGRGLKVQASAVKVYAESQDLPVLQPVRLKDPDFLSALAAFKADLFIVVAFRMLPKEVWNMPPLGTFNLHASLLPRYRGAAPIQRAIWNGETETGITTFLLDEHMDTGAVLLQKRIAILPEDNAGSLHDKLMLAGGNLVVQTTRELWDGSLKGVPQGEAVIGAGVTDHNDTSPDTVGTRPVASAFTPGDEPLPTAPKIFKEDCYLDWRLPAEKLLLQIRALSPYPTAIALFSEAENAQNTPIKVFDAKKIEHFSTSYQQGQVQTDGRRFLHIACGNGEGIAIERLQLPGKKTLIIEEFLRGFRFPESGRFVFPSK